MFGDLDNDLNWHLSIYDLVKNVAIVSGILLFRIGDQLIRMRYSILSISLFFDCIIALGFRQSLLLLAFANLGEAKVW